MIENAVITAAGLGTRMLPATKEIPKEMLPIFSTDKNGNICMKPLCQAIFEQLFDVGVRRFFFIVNNKKGIIQNHFSYDKKYLKALNEKRKIEMAEEFLDFYGKVNSSSIFFLNQPELNGFGDAVNKAKPHINGPFLVYAGDTFIVSEDNSHLSRLIKAHTEFKSEVTLLVDEVENPSSFGVIEGFEVGNGIYDVEKVLKNPRVLHPI